MDEGSLVLEIRTYRIRDGHRAAFHGLFEGQAAPMLRRLGIDLVGYGPSIEDEDHYVLLRAYRSLDELTAQESAFYGSDEWRSGPREAILALIESYHTVVLETTADAVEALGHSLGTR